MLQLWFTKRGYAGQTEVRKFVEFLKEEMNCHDGNLVTVREMNALQSAVTLCKSIYRFVGQVTDAHETDTAKLG